MRCNRTALLEKEIQSAQKKLSEYAMAFDLLTRIAHSFTEQEAIESILAVFDQLFSPETLVFVSLSHNQPDRVYALSPLPEDNQAIKERLRSFAQEHAWTASKKGFQVMIRHKDKDLGVLEVDHVKFPQEKDRYLNLTLSMIEVCGLAIENARRYQKIKDTENKLRNEKEKIRHLAITDNLTGCYNRLYISENLDREVSRSLRYKRSLSLAMFDIDQFKIVNDTYGHQCGDKILVKLINRVISNTREKVDWLARYGGDEFLLVMPEVDEKQAFHTCQRIRKIVEEMQIGWEDSVILITASFGLTGFNPAKAAISVNAEQLIKAADEALYKAKQTGRNRVAANFIKS